MAHLGAIARDSNRKNVHPMRGYTDEMGGVKIPDNKVVKLMNGRFITKHNGPNWTRKSMDRCPRYGICKTCMGSGPSGMHCQKCRINNTYYQCTWRGSQSEPKKWINMEWILRMMETTHMEARAGRIQPYPYLCTPACEITNNWMFEKMCQKYKTRPIRRPFDGTNKKYLTIREKLNVI
jgi:hypothetical protein